MSGGDHGIELHVLFLLIDTVQHMPLPNSAMKEKAPEDVSPALFCFRTLRLWEGGRFPSPLQE